MATPTRQAYTAEDECEMIQYIVSKCREGFVVDPSGNRLWQLFREETDSQRSVPSLQSKMRSLSKVSYLMQNELIEPEDLFYLVKKFKWPLSEDERITLSNRFNYFLVVNRQHHLDSYHVKTDDSDDDSEVSEDGDEKDGEQDEDKEEKDQSGKRQKKEEEDDYVEILGEGPPADTSAIRRERERRRRSGRLTLSSDQPATKRDRPN